MKRTIKSIVKLVSFGFIGLALLSCSKNETVSVNQDKAIGFNTYTGRTVTKANSSLIDKGTSTTTVLPDGAQFVVYAYNTGKVDWAGTVSNVFMKNVTVTYAGGGSTVATNYSYSPLRYWPNDETNNKLSFFAYYPAEGDGIVPPAAATQDETSNGWGDYSFTAQTDPKNMVDFCVSEVAPNQTYNSTNSGQKGVVNMKFYHTLAMVKFQVKTDKDYSSTNAAESTVITLKSISLADVKTTGILTPGNTTATWKSQAGTSDLDIFPASETGKALTTTAVFVPTGTEKDDAYLMIPQTLGNTVIATVTYTVKTGNDDAVTNTAEVVLNTAKTTGENPTTITEWKMNQNIVYTFVVGLKPIQFIAEVKDWDDVTAADFNIPVPTTNTTNP